MLGAIQRTQIPSNPLKKNVLFYIKWQGPSYTTGGALKPVNELKFCFSDSPVLGASMCDG